MRVLLLGGTGQLGCEIVLAAPTSVQVVAPDRRALDLESAAAIEAAVAAAPFDMVINAAAYTAVDQAEAEPARAVAINADAPAATARRGIPLLHVSTDYVFDGRKGAPYRPDDPVAPLGVYGASKEAGERAVRETNPHHVILRTSWLYSPFGKNFVKTMLRLAAERERLTVVDDQRGTPTAAAGLAAACFVIAARLVSDPDAPTGTFHYADAGETTWCGLARAVLVLAATRLPHVPEVVPIATDQYPTPARRPADSRLDCSATVARFAVAQPDWQTALTATLDRLAASEEAPPT
ncbi:dTDP-4-dehydrorhamnose reductase [Rhodoplanes serenus]|uniref:dTDP-4-dehydrorhamnose reductase n=1 Tax=Rhodoplanes serenus TaxID=200615 RepID=A0A9X4XLE8_9BRAD|nr:dTDP-4-dehydrorhamnose reductase [Rhodoplanes serenus]MTW17280.1 dTDP-4-dehydrorhamnose reductase [Rhodoplanes serenus]